MGRHEVSAVLLDTHVLVWLMQGVARISDAKKALIELAGREDRLFVAAITPWEIAMLTEKSRLALPMDVKDWLDAAINRLGIGLVPLSAEISVASNRLPGSFHSDPADCMIVASARHLNAMLITEDRAILAYAAQGFLHATPAYS